MDSLTIVSSCHGYGRYLHEWAASIVALAERPGAVCLFTHGAEENRLLAGGAIRILEEAGIPWRYEHDDERLDFGTARNRAVAMSASEWVMHLDADDVIMRHALGDFARIAPTADVIGAGYQRSGDLKAGPSNRKRIYSATTGLEALDEVSPCSGVSPFRRDFWTRSPYRTDMRGAWDTALWIGFARLGARFRPTWRPVFWYRQHAGSLFNRRRKVADWTQAITTAQLRGLRRGYVGVDVIVPRDRRPSPARAAAWRFLRRQLERHHPSWGIVEGFSSGAVWAKGEAVADAIARSTAAVLVIADADCLIPPEALERSVELVSSRAAPWAVPHGRVLRLSSSRTAELIGSGAESIDLSIAEADLIRPAYAGYPGGGVFVVPRAVYEASGGIPLAFRGWGSEDQAIGAILDTLAGPHNRGTADLVHLWHEPQPSKGAQTGNHQRFAAVASAGRRGPDALLETLRQLAQRPASPTRAERSAGGSRGYLAATGNPGAS